ncbi:MAG: GAF domain-containing protein [Candidatus Contendobacter sp.]|nr:MAG: GAF domain-containing protein [Candidatus Contendobacter sp.]
MNIQNPVPPFRKKFSFRHWRISNKLLVVLLLVSLAPLLAAIGIVVRTSTDALTDETRANISLLGHSVALRFSNLLLDNHNLLQVSASNPAIAAYLRAAPPATQPTPPEPVNAALTNLQQANPAIDVVGIYDPNGTVMAHTDRGLLGNDLSGRDFIGTALRGQSFVSGIRRDLVNDRLGMNFSVPIREKGAVIGAMATHLDGKLFADMFSQTLSASSDPNEAQVMTLYLVDPNGIIMSQSQGDDWLYRSLGTLSPEAARRVAEAKPLGGVCPDRQAQCPPKDKIARQPEPLPALQLLGDQVLEAFVAGRTGSMRFCWPADLGAAPRTNECSGAWHVAAYTPVLLPNVTASGNDAPAQRFMVIVDLPEQAFLNAVDQQQLFGFGIAAIMAILAIVISLLLARVIAKPINRLAATAGEVEQDKPFRQHAVAEVTTLGDEIGHLARIFSKMVLALQARMAELRTIYQVGRSISSSIDLDDTLHYVANSIRGVVPYDAMELSLLDDTQQKLVVYLAVGGDPVENTQQGYARDQGLHGQLLASGEGILLSGLDAVSEAQNQPARTWTSLDPKSYLGVPLQVKGKNIGALELVSKQQNGFDADKLRLLESIAMQAAIVIQNAQEVRARENQLKQKIQELNIEIDEIKRAKQVGEIVESDYFKRLRAQASQLRAGRSKQEPSPDA